MSPIVLILVIVLLVVAFGGHLGIYPGHYTNWGYGGGGLILLILIVLLLAGRL